MRCYDDIMPNKLSYYTFRYYAMTVRPYIFDHALLLVVTIEL